MLLLLESLVQQVDLHGEGVGTLVSVEVSQILIVLYRLIVHGQIQLLAKGGSKGRL